MAREILRERGYRVLEAADGPEAMRVCEQRGEPIDLLLTDVIMPLMSGRELAERVRNARKEMRVIYMSGYTDDVIAYHGDLGPDTDFLQKPFAPEALTRKVREVLDRDGRRREGEVGAVRQHDITPATGGLVRFRSGPIRRAARTRSAPPGRRFGPPGSTSSGTATSRPIGSPPACRPLARGL